jgi:hypothetical protein
MPSSKPIAAFQPIALIFATSNNFLGVPSGLAVFSSIVPSKPTTFLPTVPILK